MRWRTGSISAAATKPLTFLMNAYLRCTGTTLFLCGMRIFALLVPAFFIVSCMDTPKTLSVSVDSEDFIPGIIHDVTYERDGEIIDDPETVYDSVSGAYNLVWDSCSAGEYTVTVTTVFGTETVQKFQVDSDSELVVKNDLPFVPVGFLSKDSMLKADTLQFVRVVRNYSENLRTTTLIKNYAGYELSEYPMTGWEYNGPRQISAEEGEQFIDAFIESQNDIEQLRVDSADVMATGTSRQYVFIRADEEVYAYYNDAMKRVAYPEVYIP